MVHFDDQVEYWNSTGVNKAFSHPVNFAWIDGVLDERSRVLDYGCGYGRVMQLFAERGYRNVEGVDFAEQIVQRGRQLFPQFVLQVMGSSKLAYADESFDGVLLFAVLTCIPDEEEQRRLIAELLRVLRPGGVLYISDLGLQSDRRNQERYKIFQSKYGVYGVFETEDGAVCRHHSMEWLRSLVAECEVLEMDEIDVMTMNGHRSQAVQMLVRKVVSDVK